jgi:integrase
LNAWPLPVLDEVPMQSGYLAACWSPATRRCYAGDLRDYELWGGCFPATPALIAAYLTARAGHLCVPTLRRRLVGIGMAHVVAGHPDPTKAVLIRKLMRGVQRVHGMRQRQAYPISMDEILQMLPADQTLTTLRDRALLMLGFSAALRRSELVGLDVADLAFVPAGLTVRLRRSKTDQFGKSRLIGVPHGSGEACTVVAVRAWLARAQIHEGAVFRRVVAKQLGARLSDQSVNLVLKAYAAGIGLPVERVSGHSLRAGFVTAAVRAGASLVAIQRQTGHASLDMLARYIRELDPFVCNAHDALLGHSA